MKCHGNLLNGSHALIHESIRTDGRDEANGLFARLKLLILLHVIIIIIIIIIIIMIMIMRVYFNFSTLDVTL